MKINYKKMIKRMLKVEDIPLKKIEIKENNFPNYKYVMLIHITNYDIPLLVTIETYSKKEFRLGNFKNRIKNQLIDELKSYKNTNEEEASEYESEVL